MQTSRSIDVAVGVITRSDGHVLLAERPAGKPWAGYWEFPGGKFETGESPVEALARELHEELGVELDQAYPWITRSHSYPDRNVRLHMYRVLGWHGEPHGRENQQLARCRYGGSLLSVPRGAGARSRTRRGLRGTVTVLPTQSHPGAPTLCWERFAELSLDIPMPVFALGGMRLDMSESAQMHSAHGVALLSGIWLPGETD